jgi:histidinol-phosphatase (PHP family)
VRNHTDFDVLGHLTYISKARSNPTKRLLPYEWYREVYDEILKILVAKGKGMEINSSGVDRCGDFLPHAQYLRRFKELGGEIVTVGSDAHTADRVGQYMDRACQLAMEIFGHVCTFENRTPIFHKL